VDATDSPPFTLTGAWHVSTKREQPRRQVVGFLGVGLDSTDGHQRVTRNEEFFLVGGSEETHGRLQDLSVRFYESLKRRGKRLPETSADEMIDLLNEAADD
jgi:hypothetical protein